MLAASNLATGPRLREVELNEPSNPLKVTLVVRYETYWSPFRVGGRDLNSLHRSRSVDEFTLEDDEIQRALDCFGRSGRAERPPRSAQFGQR